MLFSHIVVPYDGSKLALESLDKAIEFAKIDPAIKISVIHVGRFHHRLCMFLILFIININKLF